MKKKGIVLLITVGFIAVLTSVIAYIFSITDKSFKRVENIEGQNQDIIILQDIKAILDERVSSLTKNDDFAKFLLGIPSFIDKKTKLSLEVRITPLSNKININSLLINKKIDTSINSFLESVAKKYNILDIAFLSNLLLDTIDEDSLSRSAMSEISEVDIRYTNGSIVNKEHFDTLLKYYVDMIGDESVYEVPWDELIYFGDLRKGILDCDRMSEELMGALGLDTEGFSRCDSIETQKSKEIASLYALSAYTLDTNYFLRVDISYKLDKKASNLSFVYETKTKKVSNVKAIN